CADYLVGKGLPFRDAYKCTGQLVALCIEKGTTLEELPLAEYQAVCDRFDDDLYEAISLEHCVSQRTCIGAPAPQNVRAEAARILALLAEL
ncbi:MAG: argininosuccinate lyase, partial [Clostridia bacterium]|nr:argininosuccinate lyase [Clostridia bacterium]